MTSRRHLLLGAIGAAGAALAGCSPAREALDAASPSAVPSLPPTTRAPDPTPTPSPTPTPTVRAPLTGLPVEDAAAILGPAVAIKVPNLRQEMPQTGLDVADIVFCEPNGQSYTRLCPVFHSAYPETASPIRSIRAGDVPLLAPLRPVFGNTGAAPWVMNYVNANADHLERMTYLDYKNTGAYSVDRSRIYKSGGKNQFDQAIVAHPAQMATLAKRMTAPPVPYLPLVESSEASSVATGKDAHRVEIPYGPGHDYDMSYVYDEDLGQYVRWQPWGVHSLADDTRLTTDNVLIIQADWWMDKIWKGSGAAGPVLGVVDAKGPFTYLHRGKVVTGKWAKGAVEEPFTLTASDGSPLALAPGRTWIELPHSRADVRVS